MAVSENIDPIITDIMRYEMGQVAAKGVRVPGTHAVGEHECPSYYITDKIDGIQAPLCKGDLTAFYCGQAHSQAGQFHFRGRMQVSY